jgi:GntR family transcriptional regulator
MKFLLDAGSRVPIYEQLVRQVREGVARGDLQDDERLPSVRSLARELVINPNTILRAFNELERDGLLLSRHGLGYFVASKPSDLTKTARRKRLLETLDSWLTEAVHFGFSSDEVQEIVRQRVVGFKWSAFPKTKETPLEVSA